jgi:hypothetical protein
LKLLSRGYGVRCISAVEVEPEPVEDVVAVAADEWLKSPYLLGFYRPACLTRYKRRYGWHCSKKTQQKQHRPHQVHELSGFSLSCTTL